MRILLSIILSTLLLACSNEVKECENSFVENDFVYNGEFGPSFNLYSEIKIVKSHHGNYIKLLVWDYPFTEDYYKMDSLGESIDTILVKTLVQRIGSSKKEWQLIPHVIFIKDSCSITTNDLCEYFEVLDSLDIRKKINETEVVGIDGIRINNFFKIGNSTIDIKMHSPSELSRNYYIVQATLNLIKSKLKDSKSQKYIQTLESYF